MAVFQEQERCSCALVCAVILLVGCVDVRGDVASGDTRDVLSDVMSSEDVNDLNWDLANAFEFVWDSVRLSVEVCNPQDGVGTDSSVPILTLSGRVDILDTSNFVTFDVDGIGVWEMLDESGHAVECQSTQMACDRAYQEYGWYWDEGHVYTPQEWFPFTMRIQLSTDPNRPLPSSISAVGGYIYALYADKVINVDVPFDPNCGCVETEAVPDLLICVDPSTPPLPEPIEYVGSASASPGQRVTGSSGRPKNAIALYSYATWVKSKKETRILGIRDPRCPSSLFAYGDYAVVRTGLFSSERNVSVSLQTQWVLGHTSGGTGAQCTGKMEQTYGDNYDTIRHVIAVRPVEVKIPFVLTNIPVPGLQAIRR